MDNLIEKYLDKSFNLDKELDKILRTDYRSDKRDELIVKLGDNIISFMGEINKKKYIDPTTHNNRIKISKEINNLLSKMADMDKIDKSILKQIKTKYKEMIS